MKQGTFRTWISCGFAPLGCLVELEMSHDALGESIRLQPRFADFLLAVAGRFLIFAGGHIVAIHTVESLRVIGSGAVFQDHDHHFSEEVDTDSAYSDLCSVGTPKQPAFN